MLVVVFCNFSFTQDTNYFEISKNLDIFATLYKELNTYYVDDIQPAEMMRKGIDAMLESLDPYTNFISEAEIEDYRFQTTGKYGGIGAMIGKTGDYIEITEPYEGAPAQKAGVLAGDKILSIDGKDMTGKNSDDASKYLKGQPNSKVELKVKRLAADGSEKEMTFEINREEIHINNVPYYGLVNDNIGYIQLEHFTQDAGKEVKDALLELKSKHNIKGVILDLRGNPGGLLNEAVAIANVFVDKGEEVVSTKGKVEEWDKTFKCLDNAVDKDMPLAILTNSGSASASEIVSGSMQDLDRGVIIGQRTFGKGLVQTTRPLSYNTRLKVTTAKYYIPSGRCIQAINYAEKGPDGEVKKIPDSLKVAFKTRTARVVYDGGGIDPDVNMKPEYLSQIATTLLTKNYIFNYATIYRSKHATIAPARNFHLSDKEFEDFVAYLADKDYSYDTKSDKALEDLEKNSKDEKYYEAIKEDLVALHKKMQTDKKNDIYKQKEELRSLLEEEIVERYYFRKGRTENAFNNDKEIKEAISVLEDKARYNSILKLSK
jgi:carboxyl-terminal processing protease